MSDLSISQQSAHLLSRAQAGSASATEQLLNVHREQIRRMFRVRLADRFRGRVDPSDLVQETLLEASQRIHEYLQTQPIPFYPWLRQIAQQRLTKVQEHHGAQKRDVRKEQVTANLSDESIYELATQFSDHRPGPARVAIQRERQSQIRDLVASLPETDRELLVLRYLEQLTVESCLQVLGVTRSAYQKRHFRAVARLRELLRQLPEDPQ